MEKEHILVVDDEEGLLHLVKSSPLEMVNSKLDW